MDPNAFFAVLRHRWRRVEWELGAFFPSKAWAMAMGTNGEEGEFEAPYNFYGM